jgi:hypothetical protein
MTSVYVTLQPPREALSYEGMLWIEADRLRFEPMPPVVTTTEGNGEPVGVAFSSVTDLEMADEFVDIARPGRLRTGRWHALIETQCGSYRIEGIPVAEGPDGGLLLRNAWERWRASEPAGEAMPSDESTP